MDSLHDMIRLENLYLSDDFSVLESGNTIYMKESSVLDIACENELSDIDSLCNHIVKEMGYNDTYQYMLIRDKNIPMPTVVSESHSISSADDIVLEYELDEFAFEVLREEEYVRMKLQPQVKKSVQQADILINKICSKMKGEKYDGPKDIKDRINKLKATKETLLKELDRVTEAEKKETPEEKKRDKRMYNLSIILNALIKLGRIAIGLGVGAVLSKPINDTIDDPTVKNVANRMISSGAGGFRNWKGGAAAILSFFGVLSLKAALNSTIGILSRREYTEVLQNQIGVINNTISYLEKEYDKAVATEKKAEEKKNNVKKESSEYSYASSIAELMCE